MQAGLRVLVAVIVSGCAACASYITPGGSVHLEDISHAEVAGLASRQPSPQLPASIAVVRVQAPQYKSYSSESYGIGRFSVVTAPELLTAQQLQDFSKWPSVDGVMPVERLLLPARLDSLDDLRLAAAKLQADVLLVYTLDTSFQIKGRGYGPLASISLGTVPDRDACITSAATAVFTDVRTGFTYGTAAATATASDLASAWRSGATVDQKRLEAEHQALASLLSQAEQTWSGIVKQYR